MVVDQHLNVRCWV